jgi:glutathione S-transferase
MSKPRLTYFDFAGSRGEECRIALHLAGIDFDDVRVKSADWPALKASMPFGAMPVLQMPGKPPLAHSNAILVFIGRQHGLHPVDAFEAARHEALMCAVEELRHTITPTLRIADPEQKRAAREALAANELATWGSQVERQLGDGPFVGGPLADLWNAGARARHRARSLPETPAPLPCRRRTSRREGLAGEVGALRSAGQDEGRRARL